MIKFNLFFVIGCLLLSAQIPELNAQWQTDVRLTHDTARSYTSFARKSITANGDYLHVVWMDYRNGEGEIYYKRSTNAGVSWTSDIRLTNAPGSSVNPLVVAYGSVVHIAWETDRDGNWEIYYKRSSNDGLNWTTDIRLTSNVDPQYSVSISAGLYVHAVWQDERFGPPEIYYRRSTDGGVNWGTETRLTNNAASQKYPVVAVRGPVVHVVFEDERAGSGNSEIYYKRSTNDGVNWGSDTRLTNSTGQSWNPFVSAAGSYAHVVWDDDRAGNREIYYKRSTDEGINWGPDIRLTNYNLASYSASLSLSGNFVHLVWTDQRNGHDEIYYNYSTNRGSNWVPDIRLTNNSSVKRAPSIDISGLAVYVVWNDVRDGNYEIYYKRNPIGNQVGVKNNGTELPAEYSLFQNYPNPFNPVTNINFSIPKSGLVKLIVFDIIGREVSVLANDFLSAGNYTVDFDASKLASGAYFYKISSGNFTDVKKMILVK